MSSVATIYSSSDPGAPQLSGTVGSLVALLDAVLVDGYGTGASAKAGAGWSKAFTAGSKRAYRNDPVAGSGFYLQVDDSGAVGDARQALVRGFASLTGFDTGTTPAPSVAEAANGVPIAKSEALSGTSAPWLIVGDSRFFYLFVAPWVANPANGCLPYFFGDFISFKPGDLKNWCISRNGLNAFNGGGDVDGYVFSTSNTSASIDTGRAALYLPDSQASPTASVLAHLVGGYRGSSYMAWGGSGADSVAYPHPITQGLVYSSAFIYEAVGLPRGELPGLLVPRHNKPFPDRATQVPPVAVANHNVMLPVNFVAEIWSGVSADFQFGQVLIVAGGSWWE